MVNQVVVVLGYGCVLTKNLKAYLDAVNKYINANQKHIGYIITCGGYTDPHIPQKNEADLMANYLETHGVRFIILRDHDSFTTKENLVNAGRVIQKSAITYAMFPGFRSRNDCEAKVFCLTHAQRKVKFLAPRLLPKNLKVTVGAFAAHESLPQTFLHDYLGTIVDIAGYYFPPTANIKAGLRRKRVKNQNYNRNDH
ncbi:MAG: hypothetical protein A2806_04120 [Candidatus Terrybacteria bacterium RIFCSPHIGHO2_01_FULL_48_17]|uniref:DUF218 domain-containing protein n=1 Tax=Candidatus Terrybacteria bacterium RIFCSPHIGHO2_01_FULL_48_17 TaxID=1802362 RepID=A0A1G2PKK0_9BACT|nr:MAG: hypothetical protein A2806_04120 [Candidatus Terrybacteria bacterium RIFCSPHIGHO2_01_FULL_48_17]OHA53739.1 MAG: hypothetical protein A3A30_05215 [Candidatus Terrybacteria bacterium RIFCSPLOWO2_01_FULL_48_14]